MFTLYARPGSGSAAVEALLAELGADYRVEHIVRMPDGSRPPQLLKLNPRGEVPALRLPNDSVMTESAAMMIYLADVFGRFAPALDSPQRSEYLRWMLYFASAVYMADLRYFYPQRYSADLSHADSIKSRAAEHMSRDFAIFSEALGEKKFVLGDEFSAVDLYAAMLLGWMPDLETVFQRHANLKDYYHRVIARPLTETVWRRNSMPL